MHKSGRGITLRLSQQAEPRLEDISEPGVRPYPEVKGVPELKFAPHGLQGLCRDWAVLWLLPAQEDVIPHLIRQVCRLHATPWRLAASQTAQHNGRCKCDHQSLSSCPTVQSMMLYALQRMSQPGSIPYK